MILDIFNISINEGQNAELINKKIENGISEYTLKLTWNEENAKNDHEFAIAWSTPIVGIMYAWQPKGRTAHYLDPDWCGPVSHMISNGSPVHAHYDGQGINKYTIALSEAKMLTQIRNGVVEENGNLQIKFYVGTQQFTNKYETEITVRIDERPIPVYKAIADVSKWWEEIGIKPTYVPSAAKEPCYSFWYSYHQNINEKDVEEECKRAKALGFDVCIVDDGWQTDDVGRGYAYCGDWEPCPSKFPDMAAHVKRVHDIGMKYLLWYSVPFVGYYSKSYEIFKDKFLRKNHRIKEYVLDPRYKEVRDYLIEKYKKALIEWDLDGFKLDFIDSWDDREENAPYNENMDIQSLQDAVDIFMTSVINTLREIKPDILIEFRQNYIGPNMRKFGNMFRVGDCPCDYIENRMCILDLRALMGNSAVHSDMLMWHKDESAEYDALQIIGIIFGVMQYSARLDSLNERTEKMSKFWLNFMKEKRNVLLEGELRTYDMHLNYTWAESLNGDESVAAVYAEDKCIKPELRKTSYIINGTTNNRIISEISGSYNIEILNCCGEKVSEQVIINAEKELTLLPIPVGGVAVLKKI